MEHRLDLLAAVRGSLPSRAAAFASRLRRENGTTLIELMTAMALLGIVMAGVTTAMGSATRAETDLNRRFTAQQTARLALTTDTVGPSLCRQRDSGIGRNLFGDADDPDWLQGGCRIDDLVYRLERSRPL